MKISILTSSRADYSIYYPLIKKMRDDSFFELSIIAFGSHTSPFHGHTIDNIIEDGFKLGHQIESIVIGDTPDSINSSLALTVQKFSNVWLTQTPDLLVALGDRFEMFAAVLSTLPYGMKVAHIHGGETTTGAIDNVYRHSISMIADLHFVTTDTYKSRLESLLDSGQNIYNVGALSVENILNLELMSIEEFQNNFNVNLEIPTILCTFHPETVSFENNKIYIKELLDALSELVDFQILITLPNMDTMGSYIRNQIIQYAKIHQHFLIKESLGTIGYLTAMKYCAFLLGNTSSGFVEASVFPKKVINLGERQSGRIFTNNIVQCNITKSEILEAVTFVEKMPVPKLELTYGNGTTSDQIINILKKWTLITKSI